jgi:N-acyl-phosphatidylethanolamine-hydrolysing phospholipase D
MLAGCASVNPYQDGARPHHRPDGFNNPHIDNRRADAPSFWRWQLERLFGEHAADELHRVRSVPMDASLPHADRGDVTVTWIGHSTVRWQIGGRALGT